MGADHQGRGPDAEQGRGAGPDRRERRGQVDAGPCRDGIHPRRGADFGGHGEFRRRRADDGLGGGETATPRQADRLCGAIGGGEFQPGAPDHRPAYRGAGGAWHVRAQRQCPGRHGPLRQAAPAEPAKDRVPLSASGVRRAVAAGDDGDGDGVPPRPHHLRRADDGPRRDDADRGAGRDPRYREPVRDGGDLYHPRPGGGGADGRPDQGAAARRRGRGGGDAGDARDADRRTIPSPSGRCAVSSGRRSLR